MSKTMGAYCKAYQLHQLRAFPGWRENAAAARPGDHDASGAPRVLTDGDVVYLQENHVVTDGIFKDENVLFDAVDDAWKDFCRETLGFAIPEDVLRASSLAAEDAEA
jgi:hypothetical protein